MRLETYFSGIGGFELGFEGIARTISVSEIDSGASAVLAHRFPTAPNVGDITEVQASDLPREQPDIITGGFPCQDLSIAGRRAGLAGDRSGLFYDLARLIGSREPRWILLENVPGLLSSHRGRDMGAVLGTLGDLGYGWSYRVLDARFHGVPQRRRRVFIVGYLGDPARAGEILFEREGVPGDPPARSETRQEVAALTAAGVGTCGADDNQGQAGHLIPSTYRLQAFGEYAKDDVASTVQLRDHKSATDLIVPVAVHENQRGEVRTAQHFSALSTGGGKPGQGYPAVLTAARVRRLTPIECERLQGFPDGWTLVPARTLKSGQVRYASDSARYKQLGNAVAVPVVRWIAERIARAEGIEIQKAA